MSVKARVFASSLITTENMLFNSLKIVLCWLGTCPGNWLLGSLGSDFRVDSFHNSGELCHVTYSKWAWKGVKQCIKVIKGKVLTSKPDIAGSLWSIFNEFNSVGIMIWVFEILKWRNSRWKLWREKNALLRVWQMEKHGLFFVIFISPSKICKPSVMKKVTQHINHKLVQELLLLTVQSLEDFLSAYIYKSIYLNMDIYVHIDI